MICLFLIAFEKKEICFLRDMILFFYCKDVSPFDNISTMCLKQTTPSKDKGLGLNSLFDLCHAKDAEVWV